MKKKDREATQALAREVRRVKWFHTIDLGQGIVTPGHDDTPARLKKIHMPKDLHGKTVLDLGSWDGFYSFEAARRGASRVLATDSVCWGGVGTGKAGFELARRTLGSPVEDHDIDVMDISPENVGVFDVVLFLGVLYHMRHPLLSLERVAAVTGHQLILETHVDMLYIKRPAMAFYPGAELSNDASNWCGPNPAAVEAMLKTVGFRTVEVVSHAGPAHTWPQALAYRLGSAAKRQVLHGTPSLRTLTGGTIVPGRMVFHAFR